MSRFWHRKTIFWRVIARLRSRNLSSRAEACRHQARFAKILGRTLVRGLCMFTLTSVALLCLAVAPPASDTLAQEKQRLVLNVDAANTKITKQYRIDVGDAPGQQVRFFEIHCPYPSNAPAINGIKIVESWTRGMTDHTENNGVATPYEVFVLKTGKKLFTRGA